MLSLTPHQKEVLACNSIEEILRKTISILENVNPEEQSFFVAGHLEPTLEDIKEVRTTLIRLWNYAKEELR